MQIAKSIVLNVNTGDLYINGVPIGYALAADDDVEVHIDTSGVSTVRVTFFTDYFAMEPVTEHGGILYPTKSPAPDVTVALDH